MKALKIKLYQDLVCYRKPMSFRTGETYPLPPPSTINGFLHNILGAHNYIPMIFSIQGTYASITSNLQKLYKFGSVKKTKGEIRNYLAVIGNTSVQSDVYYTNLLVNVNLVVHINASEEILQCLLKTLLSPTEYPSLSRREDLVRIDEVSFVSFHEVEEKRNGISLKYPAYIPKQLALNNDLCGVNYQLNSYYEIKGDFKKWEQIEMLYVESGKVYTKTVIDEQGDLIFWHK